MQQLAEWLVARPWHGVVGLVLALIFPMLTPASSGLGPVFGGLVMTHLVLANGPIPGVMQGLAAGLLLALLAILLQASVGQIVFMSAVIWTPACVLAALMLRLRSLTLTLQVTVILAIVGVVVIYIALGDPAVYWGQLLDQWAAIVSAGGQEENAELLLASREAIVPQMTMIAVFTVWTWLVLVLLLGYGLYQNLPDKRSIFGRFSDLNYGRVLATVMGVGSLVALATGMTWLQNLAFVAFAVFWLQGLAILHWLHGRSLLPLFVLVATYAFLVVPVLNGLLVIALAVFGYMDAWFNFRARQIARSA